MSDRIAEPKRPSRFWSLLRLGWAKSGRTVGVLNVWVLVENLTAWRQRIRPIRAGSMLRYALGHHRGQQVVLRDGTTISGGDPIIELHFDNHRLVELSSSGTSPWPFLQHARDDLAELERLLSSGAISDVKALHARSLRLQACASASSCAPSPGPGDLRRSASSWPGLSSSTIRPGGRRPRVTRRAGQARSG